MIVYTAGVLRHYLTLPVFLAAVLAGCVCLRVCLELLEKEKILRRQCAALAALSFYLVLFVSFLIVSRTLKDERRFYLDLFWSYRAAAAGKRYLLYLNFLNALLFVPVGLICPMAERKPGFWKTLCLGAALSLLAELLQVLSSRGVFELDDVFHNALGTILGAGIWLLVSRIRERRRRLAGETSPAEKTGENPDFCKGIETAASSKTLADSSCQDKPAAERSGKDQQ